MISRTGNRQHGFTLTEVLVSIAILSVGAVAVMQALGSSAAAMSVAEARADAHRFAVTKMAEVELDVRLVRPLDENDGGSFIQGTRVYRWSLSSPVTEEEAGLRPAALAVEWELGGKPYAYTIQTAFRVPPSEEEQ
ncbi:MAG: type II secretion system protein [Candidatus Omnitrophica bacterium]|nr:type II secretion system protein [Candidatus Omnitrophota bacterium]